MFDVVDMRRSRDRSRPCSDERRPPTRRWMLGAGLSLWVAIAAVVTWIGRDEWRDLVAGVQSTATTVSRLLADHSDRLLVNADLVRYQAELIVGSSDPLAGDRAMHFELQRLVDIAPAIVSIWIGDAEGRAVLTTHEFPAPALSAADREYFTTVRDDPDRLFVGNLLDNRHPAEALLINTSRRLSAPDGDMRGFVQVSLDPASIAGLFKQVDIGLDASVWWIGPDGRALIREPALPLAQLDRKAPPGHAGWPAQVANGGAKGGLGPPAPISSVSGLDGEARLFFWSDSPVYGSRMIVGVSHEAMVSRWMASMASTVGLGLAVGVAGMVILWLQHRASVRNLSYAARLESDVRDRTRELDHAVEQKGLILQELEHRVRNAFATILALTRQMLRSSDTLEDFRREFPARLDALARTHLLLIESEDRGRAQIVDLAEAALSPYRLDEAQFAISGPALELSSATSLGVGIILHELATNAVKHGSLSAAGGTVSVHWDVEANGVHLVWREVGRPPVVARDAHGSGTAIINRAASLIGGSVIRRFESAGVRVDLRFPSTPA